MPGLYKNKTVLSHELIILLIIDYLVFFKIVKNICSLFIFWDKISNVVRCPHNSLHVNKYKMNL